MTVTVRRLPNRDVVVAQFGERTGIMHLTGEDAEYLASAISMTCSGNKPVGVLDPSVPTPPARSLP